MPLDRESWLYRTGRRLALTAAVLMGVGLACAPLQNRVWGEVKSFQPEMNLRDLEDALGQGVIIGLLGGFRTLVADFVYLRASYYWEKSDRPNTEALLALTTSIDPRPLYFWLNAARIISYDIPVWRVRERGDFEDVPQAYKDHIYQEQVDRAMGLLDRAQSFHPDNMQIPLEKARIYYDKVKDYENAAKYYHQVTQMPDAPYYAARIYANALDNLGRSREAYEFLRELYPTLPPSEEVPQASREVVLERIREFENDLDMPLIERFPPQSIELAAPDPVNLTPFSTTGEGTSASED
ncbi:tetratricopeptide repeat protein [Cerasicoccus arenae]|uniref:Tetratricopeptide repeat protein n=1 Tax=Cerasicoccus arenae TaxID=424488 RepID=A0A8J3GE86_9BACT|nr:hypothetical protein [Cerasicoccus arenae]MBK1859519.1 hypothetical protein [Cerasicoccus arenae]GHB97095.1 hypothetical protein GCM10007047_11360 [Cerasicoccus arenae]